MVRTKPRKEASLLAVASAAVGSAIIGVMLGFAHEVARPAVFGDGKAAETRAAELRSPRHAVPSAEGGTSWRRNIESLAAGGSTGSTFSFSEGDLNGMVAEYLNFPETKDGIKDNVSTGILPESPVFAIPGSSLQIAVPFEILLFGAEGEATFVAMGDFSGESKNGPQFDVSEAWINSAKIPGVFAKILLGHLVAQYESTAPDSVLLAAWRNVDRATVRNRRLDLERD